MDLSFLPRLPQAISHLTWFGVLLVAGLLCGELARRYAGLPRITGYVVAGAALGPEGTGVIGTNALFELRLLVDLAIGLIVFELGFRLDLDWLRRNRWLLAGALAESLLAFVAIFATLGYLGFRPLLAATAAAIGTATSPAVVLLVSQELRAQGQVTERMLLFTAVNTVFAYLLLALLLPFLHLEHRVTWDTAVLHSLYAFVGAVALAGGGCWLLLSLAAWVGKREDLQFVLLVAILVVAIGAAHSLKLSVPVALVSLGMMARNLDRRHALLPVHFGYGGQLFFVVLFVLTGASLEFHTLGIAGAGAVAAFIVVRFLGKALGALLFGAASGIAPGGSGLLALSLLPMSGLAVVMVRETFSLYPSFGAELSAIVLAAVVVLELAGPVATQFALRRAGEAHPDG